MATRRVLIVDDEELVRLSLRDMLEIAGYEVAGEAADGDEALRQVGALNPDVVLMDINMPVKDGVDAAREISASYPVPILFLTGYADARSVTRASQAGGYGYLVKPCRQSDLGPAIETAAARFAEGRRYQQEAEGSRWAVEALHRLAREIAGNPDIQEVVAMTLRGAVSLLKVPAAALLLVRADEVRMRDQVGLDPAYAAAFRAPVGSTIFGRTVADGAPASFAGEGEKPGADPETPATHPFGRCGSALAVPLQTPAGGSEDRVLGCLAVFRAQTDPFTTGDITLLSAMAGELVLAFQTAQIRCPIAWRRWLAAA
ncbi:MAG: response regulator [Armatimonadetes bacterium]|nr:response regulator [Armatimonadota bacterium]